MINRPMVSTQVYRNLLDDSAQGVDLLVSYVES